MRQHEDKKQYKELIQIGVPIFSQSKTLASGVVGKQDIELAQTFLARAAENANPTVWGSYWEHIFIASELGKHIAESAQTHGGKISAYEVEFLLFLHEIGRLVSPGDYLGNELITQRFLVEFGLAKSLVDCLPSTMALMKQAEDLKLSGEQLQEKVPLSTDQEKQVADYFAGLSFTQRIINLADNLGKRDANGLFDLAALYHYLQTQEYRYEEIEESTPDRLTAARPAGAFLQMKIVSKTIEWLNQMQVDVGEILRTLCNFDPKFILIVRHGELENPKAIVYNRDSVMRPEDVLHLNTQGKEQMEELAQVIGERKFHCTALLVSPETRTRESADILARGLGLEPVVTDDLEEVYAPGPYLEGMTTSKWLQIHGNVYDTNRWGNYHHETPKEIVARMERAFRTIKERLGVGETGIIVSHGDPIAYLVNYLATGKIPPPDTLKSSHFSTKGQGVVVVLDPHGNFFTTYILNPSPKKKNPSVST